MKNKIAAILSILLLPFLTLGLPAVASAASTYEGPYTEICAKGTASTSSVCAEGSDADPDDPITGNGGIIIKAVNILSFIIGFASIVILIIAGLKYMTANGDASAVGEAKNTVVYAVIGILVALVAQGLIFFVLNKIG